MKKATKKSEKTFIGFRHLVKKVNEFRKLVN